MAKGLSMTQIGGVVAAIAVVAVGAGVMALQGGGPVPPAEVSVNVDCEEIDATRQAVDQELEAKKEYAKTVMDAAMELASDHYWEKRRAHESVLNACLLNANLADPCKELFEEQRAVVQGATNDPAAERVAEWDAKIQAAKNAYNNCVENREQAFENMKTACQKAFDAADKAALAERAAEEATAQSTHNQYVSNAVAAQQSKHGALNALEEQCKAAAEEEEIIGSVGTGGTTVIPPMPQTDPQPDSAACTGVFPASNPDLQEQINDLKRKRSTEQALLKQEQLGGDITQEGLGGASSRSDKINELTQEITELEKQLAAGGAVCRTDADCGDPTPVCCDDIEVGKVMCEKGVFASLFGGTGKCVNETELCEDGEVCGGKPAQCVAIPTVTVDAIAYGGSHIPVSQLRKGTGSECDQEEHWHASGSVTTTDGERVSDPDPNGCGFGKTSEVPVVQVEIPADQLKVKVRMGF